MLSGLRAFGRSTTVETLSAVLRDEPLPFDAPADLSTIIARCLRKSAAERFQTIGQVRTALEQADRKPAEKAPSIAVLPFANMSRDLDDEYFSDGLAEEIINLLANIPGLKVIARTSAFAFKGKNEDIRRIAETLGVANVLEGSVRRAGSKLRITAQLIHAIDGTHLWSQRYDRDMTDIFELQDEMSTAIAEQLKVRLIPAKHATTNVAAYEAYLEGRHHAQKFAPDALAKALACFERAVALDPNYAPVHVGMAEYYLIHSNLGFQRPLEVLPKLEAAAQRALALDPSLADAHSLLACARMFLDYNWDEAERLCKRGLALNPTSISTTGAYATFYLRAQGHPELALPALDRTLELDPLATLPHWSKGQSLFCCRRYPEAEREFRRVLEIDPHQAGARWDLGPTLAMQQRFTEAVAEAEEFAQRFGRRSMPLRTLAVVHALAGQTDKARSELAELHACERKGYVPATYFAEIYTLLQELDAAFTWINRAIDQRDPHLLMWIRFQPFDLLRGDPRYLSLLQRMKLA
jgi:serine/threonine-protein kinase